MNHTRDEGGLRRVMAEGLVRMTPSLGADNLCASKAGTRIRTRVNNTVSQVTTQRQEPVNPLSTPTRVPTPTSVPIPGKASWQDSTQSPATTDTSLGQHCHRMNSSGKAQ